MPRSRTPLSLYFFSGWRSPACGYHSALLVLHSHQVGEPHMHISSRCVQLHPAIPTKPIPRWRGMCTSAMAPSCSCWHQLQKEWVRKHYSSLASWTEHQVQEKRKQWQLLVPPGRECSFSSCGAPTTGLAKKFIWFFLYDGSSSAQLSLTSFKTILLDCIVTAVISACI